MTSLDGESHFDHVVSKKNITKYYVLGKELGRGASSSVKESINLLDAKKYAVKQIPKNVIKLNLLEREISIMKKLKHPHVLPLYEVYEDDDYIYLVLQLLRGGELYDKIVAKGSYKESDAAKIVCQILRAVQYLHESGVVHRDLKPENLLCANDFENSLHIYVADFGLSKIVDPNEPLTTYCGSPEYVAPEIIDCAPYHSSVDLWSIGVITYILLTGFLPFYEQKTKELFEKIKNVEYNWSDCGPISAEAKHFVSSLLVGNPQRRMTAVEALQHPWIRKYAPSSLSPQNSSKDIIPNFSTLTLNAFSSSSNLPPILAPSLSPVSSSSNLSLNNLTNNNNNINNSNLHQNINFTNTNSNNNNSNNTNNYNQTFANNFTFNTNPAGSRISPQQQQQTSSPSSTRASAGTIPSPPGSIIITKATNVATTPIAGPSAPMEKRPSIGRPLHMLQQTQIPISANGSAAGNFPFQQPTPYQHIPSHYQPVEPIFKIQITTPPVSQPKYPTNHYQQPPQQLQQQQPYPLPQTQQLPYPQPQQQQQVQFSPQLPNQHQQKPNFHPYEPIVKLPPQPQTPSPQPSPQIQPQSPPQPQQQQQQQNTFQPYEPILKQHGFTLIPPPTKTNITPPNTQQPVPTLDQFPQGGGSKNSSAQYYKEPLGVLTPASIDSPSSRK